MAEESWAEEYCRRCADTREWTEESWAEEYCQRCADLREFRAKHAWVLSELERLEALVQVHTPEGYEECPACCILLPEHQTIDWVEKQTTCGCECFRVCPSCSEEWQSGICNECATNGGIEWL